jgi:uncharacterized protein (TIGR03437 family)
MAAGTNAASFQLGPVAPGEVVTLFGAGLGPGTPAGAQLDSSGNLSGSVGGTQVLFDGNAAPIVFVSDGQSSVIVPYAVAGKPKSSAAA